MATKAGETSRAKAARSKKRRRPAHKPSPIQVEIDGPAVSPDSVDALLMLRLTTSFLSLASALATDARKPFTLNGLHVRDKCVALETMPSDEILGALFCKAAATFVAGTDPCPGHDLQVDEIRRLLRTLPHKHAMRVSAKGLKRRVAAPRLPEPVEDLYEQAEMRARVLRVGGKQPRVLLASQDVDGVFSLAVSEDQARRLGGLLYKDVDIEALVSRDAGGRLDGRLVDAHELEAVAGADPWLTWFQEQGWTDVEDVDAELARDVS